jgi:hypothetical protein
MTQREAMEVEFAQHLLLTLTEFLMGKAGPGDVDRATEGWMLVREGVSPR